MRRLAVLAAAVVAVAVAVAGCGGSGTTTVVYTVPATAPTSIGDITAPLELRMRAAGAKVRSITFGTPNDQLEVRLDHPLPDAVLDALGHPLDFGVHRTGDDGRPLGEVVLNGEGVARATPSGDSVVLDLNGPGAETLRQLAGTRVALVVDGDVVATTTISSSTRTLQITGLASHAEAIALAAAIPNGTLPVSLRRR